MSARPMATNNNSNNMTRNSVLLPDKDLTLWNWKQKHGAFVSAGETIAYATAAKTTASSSSQVNNNAPAAANSHRRPTKKQKISNNKSVSVMNLKKKDVSTNAAAKNTLIPIVSPSDGLLHISSATANNNKEDSLVIGWIQECTHPAIMDGLCAICGKKPQVETNTTTITTTSTKQKQQVTVSGGVTMMVSEQEAQQISRQKSQRLLRDKKLSLVLDLDHTLVHATADPRAKRTCLQHKEVRTLLLPLMEHPGSQRLVMVQHYVKLRPHVKEFLLNSMENYETSVYTAGTRMYAQQVTMVLCRHLVGSQMDEPDLNRLRHDHHIAVQQYRKQQQEKGSTEKQHGKTVTLSQHLDKIKIKTGKPKTSPDQSGTTSTTASPPLSLQETRDSGNKDEQDSKSDKPKDDAKETTEPASTSRKTVSFGALPPKHNTVTLEQVESLSKGLQEAERLEKEAMELRQRLFGSRIVSRTDVGDLGPDVKSLTRIFPCGGTMAAVVDDREDVWAKADDNAATSGCRPGEPPENLLLVRPYHWKPFVGFAEVNNPSGRLDLGNNSGAETNDTQQNGSSEDEETDVQLLWTSDILKRLHTRFYAARVDDSNRTVPQILREMRQEVLAGKRLVLSGLVRIDEQQRQQDQSLPRPRFVRYAESLGAKVSDTVRSDTTHVVAARDRTDKTNRARPIHGCVVVKELWLRECLRSLTLRNETPHLLGAVSSNTSPKAASAAASSQSRPPLSSSTDSSDDDGLAAELENEMMDL